MTRSFTNKILVQGLQRMRSRRQIQGQPKPGVMNKAELQYAAYLSHCADVVAWKYEPMSFWLADKLRYIPDFIVEYKKEERFEMHAVDIKAVWSTGKPGMEEEALAKIKMFAQEYGCWFVVKMVWFQRTTGIWEQRMFEPQERSGEGAQDDHPKA